MCEINVSHINLKLHAFHGSFQAKHFLTRSAGTKMYLQGFLNFKAEGQGLLLLLPPDLAMKH